MSCTLDVDEIVTTLRRILPAADRTPLHEPEFAGNEWRYVKECLDTGWVSSAGSYVDRFEDLLADVTGARRAIAVVNGTAALHVALRLAGVGEGDEVLVPALTFVATANAVSYTGAVPHFVDADPISLGLDAEKLARYLESVVVYRDGSPHNRHTGRRIRAMLPMHTFGHPVDLDPLAALSERYDLALVEDAAEGLGSRYKNRHVGRTGALGILSFNGNKTITTGGGGAILTDDEDLADRAKHLTTTAKVDHRWDYFHDRIGYNYRLPNINAALGCAQIEQLPSVLDRKRRLATQYAEAFEPVDGVEFVTEPPFAESNYWLNAILLHSDHAEHRDEVLERTNGEGIVTRPAWTLMPNLPMYDGCPHMDLSVAKNLARRIVNIPSSASLVSTSSNP